MAGKVNSRIRRTKRSTKGGKRMTAKNIRRSRGKASGGQKNRNAIKKMSIRSHGPKKQQGSGRFSGNTLSIDDLKIDSFFSKNEDIIPEGVTSNGFWEIIKGFHWSFHGHGDKTPEKLVEFCHEEAYPQIEQEFSIETEKLENFSKKFDKFVLEECIE